MARHVTRRSLAPGEAVPAGEPLRYRTEQGYIRLRWRVAPNAYIEVPEHRVFDGRNSMAEHVHHVNHVRDDNRRENLQEMTMAEHVALHREHALEQYREWRKMYEAGMTTTAIADECGTNAGNVYKGLVEVGTRIRHKTEYVRRPMDTEEVIRRYKSGEGATSIAKSLRISYARVTRAIESNGITRRPAGRVPGANAA